MGVSSGVTPPLIFMTDFFIARQNVISLHNSRLPVHNTEVSRHKVSCRIAREVIELYANERVVLCGVQSVGYAAERRIIIYYINRTISTDILTNM